MLNFCLAGAEGVEHPEVCRTQNCGCFITYKHLEQCSELGSLLCRQAEA